MDGPPWAARRRVFRGGLRVEAMEELLSLVNRNEKNYFESHFFYC
jgi:cytochrome P450